MSPASKLFYNADFFSFEGVDNEGNFVMSPARGALKFEGVTKIPHAVLAKENPIYGAGEVSFKNGKVEVFNSITGHYYPGNEFKSEFDEQVKKVFLDFMERAGLSSASGQIPSFSLCPLD